jgi:phosphatidylglycerophosphate synthase
MNRRPLKSRDTAWARGAAAGLARAGVSPNAISTASVGFALAGAGALLAMPQPWSLLVCAACIQARLLCNLLDGMVAVEEGRQSPTGALFNEIPDRIADALFIVAAGYLAQRPWLGWCAAWLAAITAYIRALGGSLGLPQDFRGPMAKPHRMALLTAACVAAAAEQAWHHTAYVMAAALWLIAAGSALTCLTRTRAMAAALRARGTR